MSRIVHRSVAVAVVLVITERRAVVDEKFSVGWKWFHIGVPLHSAGIFRPHSGVLASILVPFSASD